MSESVTVMPAQSPSVIRSRSNRRRARDGRFLQFQVQVCSRPLSVTVTRTVITRIYWQFTPVTPLLPLLPLQPEPEPVVATSSQLKHEALVAVAQRLFRQTLSDIFRAGKRRRHRDSSNN